MSLGPLLVDLLRHYAEFLSATLPIMTAVGMVGLTMGTIDRWILPPWIPTRPTVTSTRSKQVMFWVNWSISVLYSVLGAIILPKQGRLSELVLPLLITGGILIPLWLLARYFNTARNKPAGK